MSWNVHEVKRRKRLAKEHRRDAYSTQRRRDTGGSPLREDAVRLRQGFRRRALCYGVTRRCAQLGAYIRFCETNPPFWRTNYCVTSILKGTYVACGGFLQVGSFWKTNPPGGCFSGVFLEKWVRLPQKHDVRRISCTRNISGAVGCGKATSLRVAQPVLRSACHGSTACGVSSDSAPSGSAPALPSRFGLRVLFQGRRHGISDGERR